MGVFRCGAFGVSVLKVLCTTLCLGQSLLKTRDWRRCKLIRELAYTQEILGGGRSKKSAGEAELSEVGTSQLLLALGPSTATRTDLPGVSSCHRSLGVFVRVVPWAGFVSFRCSLQV